MFSKLPHLQKPNSGKLLTKFWWSHVIIQKGKENNSHILKKFNSFLSLQKSGLPKIISSWVYFLEDSPKKARSPWIPNRSPHPCLIWFVRSCNQGTKGIIVYSILIDLDFYLFMLMLVLFVDSRVMFWWALKSWVFPMFLFN